MDLFQERRDLGSFIREGMGSFLVHSTSSSASAKEPPRSNLEYYARPENYEGTHPIALQRILLAKDSNERSEIPLLSPKKGARKRRKYRPNLLSRYPYDPEEFLLPEVADIYDDRHSSESSGEESIPKSSQSDKSAEEEEQHRKFCVMNVVTLTRRRRTVSEKKRLTEYIREGKFPRRTWVLEERGSEVSRDKKKGLIYQTTKSQERDVERITEGKEQGRFKGKSVTRRQPGKGPRPRKKKSLVSITSKDIPTIRMVESCRSSLPGSSTGISKRYPDEQVVGSGRLTRPRDHSLLSPARSRKSGLSSSTGSSRSVSNPFNMRQWPRSEGKTRPKMTRGIELFQHAVRLVLVIRDLSRCLANKSCDKTSKKTIEEELACMYNDSIAETKGKDEQNIMFDPNYYRPQHESPLSSKVKLILTTTREMRTPAEIRVVMHSLQDLRAFNEYPVHLQEKMCQVGWYSSIGHNRIVIRQGHIAENFYIIISGQAVVTLAELDPQTGEPFLHTAAVLSRGMSFGELALLHHAPRTATVRSSGQLELLAIGRNDFYDIIGSIGKRVGSMPRHVHFLSRLPFMRSWPIHVLEDKLDHCICTYFKPGTLIVQSSLKSDWIVAVMSGSCEVIKKLHTVAPRLYVRRKDVMLSQKPPFSKLGHQTFSKHVCVEDCHFPF